MVNQETQTKIYNFIDERIDNAVDHMIFSNNEEFLSYSFISGDKFAISFNCHYVHPITPLSIIVFDIIKDKMYTFPCSNVNTYKQHVRRIKELAESFAINELMSTASVDVDERIVGILDQKNATPNIPKKSTPEWVQEEINLISFNEDLEK